MKKILLSIATISLFAGCTQSFEEEVNVNAGNGANLPAVEVSVGASAQDAVTKATWDKDLKSYWETGDQIALLQAYAPAPAEGEEAAAIAAGKLDLQSGENTPNGRFAGTVTAHDVPAYVYAAYPASSKLEVKYDATLEGDAKYTTSVQLVCPSSQSGKYKPVLYAVTDGAVALSDVKNIAFQTLNAAVTVRFADNGVSKQLKYIKISSSQRVAGYFEGSATGAEPVSLAFRGSSYYIEVANAMAIEKTGENWDYTVAIAPQTYEDLTISVVTVDNVLATRTVKNVKLEANHRKGYIINWEESGIEAIDLSNPDGTGVETANCYVAGAAGTTYKFPAIIMGNGYTTPADPDYVTTGNPKGTAPGIKPSTLTPLSAKLLWQTSAGLLSEVQLLDGCVYFKSNGEAGGTLTAGNAVIAIYSGENGTGDILWSWHIWVTDVDLDSKVQTWKVADRFAGYSNYVDPQLMDRNLGALTTDCFSESGKNAHLGLYYQWGRKDPFIGVDDSGFNSTAQADTYDAEGNKLSTFILSDEFTSNSSWLCVSEKISRTNIAKYPMAFVYYASKNRIWFAESAHDLWGCPGYKDDSNYIGHKTIYDPCPRGYRVMNAYAMTKVHDSYDTSLERVDESKYSNLDKAGISYSSVINYSGFKTTGDSLQIYCNDNNEIAELPIAGMIRYDATATSGLYYRIGNYGGWYWTAKSPSNYGNSGYRVDFDYGNFRTKYNAYGAYGHSVRCEKIK